MSIQHIVRSVPSAQVYVNKKVVSLKYSRAVFNFAPQMCSDHLQII